MPAPEPPGRRRRRAVRLGQVQRLRARWPAGWACATSTPARCTARSPGGSLDQGVDLDDSRAVARLARELPLRDRHRPRRHPASPSTAQDVSRGDPRAADLGSGQRRRDQPRRPRASWSGASARSPRQGGGIVVEGRDITTVVAPGRRRPGAAHRVRAGPAGPARARGARQRRRRRDRGHPRPRRPPRRAGLDGRRLPRGRRGRDRRRLLATCRSRRPSQAVLALVPSVHDRG